MDDRKDKSPEEPSELTVGSGADLRARRFDEPDAENVVRLGARHMSGKGKADKNASLDLDWFYEDEAFFTEWMDALDW